MARVPTPPIAPRTGLWGLGFRFDLISLRFDKLRNDIKDVWLIGTWLSYPFYAIGYYFSAAKVLVWQADDSLVDAITWIKGIVDGNTVIDILERLWWEFRFLRADPVGWVRTKIDEVSGELQWLRIDPIGWTRSRFYLALPEFSSILNNSAFWVYSRLIQWKPDFGTFIRNPRGYIRDKVLSSFSSIRALDWNPSQTVIDWLTSQSPWFHSFMVNPSGTIVDLMTRNNYNLGLLISNPVQWFKQRLASVLGMQTYELDDFIPSLIKRFFSAILGNQAGLLDYVKTAVCDIILRFI